VDITHDPNILAYATPVPRRALPWWMIVSATLFYLAAACVAGLIVSRTLSDDIVANGILLTLLTMVCIVERSALAKSGTCHSAVILVLVAVLAGLIPFSVIGMTVVMHKSGPYSAIEIRLILLGIGIAVVGGFVAISHLRWWARSEIRPALPVTPPSA
jgi:hypothetical protein